MYKGLLVLLGLGLLAPLFVLLGATHGACFLVARLIEGVFSVLMSVFNAMAGMFGPLSERLEWDNRALAFGQSATVPKASDAAGFPTGAIQPTTTEAPADPRIGRADESAPDEDSPAFRTAPAPERDTTDHDLPPEAGTGGYNNWNPFS